MNYMRFLWQKAYIGVFLVLMCACLGSIRGAVKESSEPFIGVTEEDLAAMDQPKGSAPDMVGVIALASEQSRWYNFSYAVHYAGRGFVLYCVVMAMYLPLYSFPCFVTMRKLLNRNARECVLWIEPDCRDLRDGATGQSDNG